MIAIFDCDTPWWYFHGFLGELLPVGIALGQIHMTVLSIIEAKEFCTKILPLSLSSWRRLDTSVSVDVKKRRSNELGNFVSLNWSAWSLMLKTYQTA